MMDRMQTTELERLQVEQARVELANSIVEGGLLKQQLHAQRGQLQVQLAIAIVSLLTASAACWSSCRSDRRSTATYESASAAVASIGSAQQIQHERVERLRDYTVEMIELVDAAPPIVAASSSVATLPVAIELPPPPPPAPPPPDITMSPIAE